MTYAIAIGIVALLAVGAIFWQMERQTARLRDEVTAERMRALFAQLRYRLVELVADDKASPTSSTFKFFYASLTLFIHMRPRYRVAARSLGKPLVPTDSTITAWSKQAMKEVSDWSPELQQVVVASVDAIDEFIRVYARKELRDRPEEKRIAKAAREGADQLVAQAVPC